LNINKKSILQKGRGNIRKQAKLEYRYEKESLYFAQVSESIKELAITELRKLGAGNIKPVFRGIWFTASKRKVYRITYTTRLLSRILAPLASFACKDKDELYRGAKKIRWEEFLSPKKTLAITANVSESPALSHSKFAALRVKDAIADYFMDRSNRRPNVDTQNPFIEINLYIHKDLANLSIDVSGGTLHKRGYREESVAAPMQEIVAASIIRLSEWDGSQPLYDPMCGSGTLLCEALMDYCHIPAQIFRTRFGVERLPDFDPVLWKDVKNAENELIQPLPSNLIAGSDLSENAVQASRTNLMGLHYGNEVNIGQSDFRDIKSLENHVIVCNPPYGIRMGKDENLNRFYQELGQFLKEKCKNSKAFIFFGEPRYIKKVPLAPTWKRPLTIGGLDGRLLRYDIF
jgi:putative N6-adenine-specific DNA methylase